MGDFLVATKTYFASPARNTVEEIENQVRSISQNPVINGLLEVVGGFLAVLNENRQIIAINEKLSGFLGKEVVKDVFGLRPGEALHCIHSDETPGGCGTGKFCSSCGAAIAIVSSLDEDRPTERTCALAANQSGQLSDLFFSVRSHPFRIEEERYLLLFLQDISKQQQWVTLERIFYHDINNILTGLIGASDLLIRYDQEKDKKLVKDIHQLSVRLAQEIKIQQALTKMDTHLYQAVINEVHSAEIFAELQDMFHHHPAARGRTILFADRDVRTSFPSDACVLVRILANMITNALEATKRGGNIKVWLEKEPDSLGFYVWNRQFIPPEIANRIFQRNFSTKGELGRGLGTYSMKLFGETILGGKVGFNSTEQQGTTFYLTLPM